MQASPPQYPGAPYYPMATENLLKKRYVLALNALGLLAIWLAAIIVIWTSDLNARGFARFLTLSGGLIAAAGPTKRPWTQAPITRRAPWAFNSFAAVAIVPPVEMTSSTIATDFPRTARAFGVIFTVYESIRSFSRESNGTPAIADASFANRIALSSGARSMSTFVDLRYRPIAGMPLTSRAGSGKVFRIPAL